MATTYLTPGVYIEEIDRGPKPIQGVGTNVTAFIGFTEKAEEPIPGTADLLTRSVLGKAQMITNLSQYEKHFGKLHEDAYLPYAVRGFFENGGVRCYVISIRALKPMPGQLLLYSRDPKNPDDATKSGRPSVLIYTKESVPAGAEVKVNVRWANGGQARPSGRGADAAKPKAENKAEDAPKGDAGPNGPTAGGGPPAPPAPAPISGGSQSNVPEADFWLDVEYVVDEPGKGKQTTKRDPVAVKLDGLPLYGEPTRPGATTESFPDLRVWRLTKNGPSGPPMADRLPKAGAYTLSPGYPRIDLDLLDAPESQLVSAKADEATVLQVFKDKSTLLFEGSEPKRKSIGALEALDDVNLICAPDLMMAYQKELIDGDALIALQKALLAHCERSSYRFAILDAPPQMNPQGVYNWRMKEANLDSMHGALYYPWVKIQDPVTNKTKFIPPCGHMAGIYARSDSERGVHKAPANEQVRFCIDVETNVTRGEQDLLNPVGINCIRSFSGRGIRVWGARTLSSDPSWRYINVRRLFNYVEESIERSTQWIVFEPNDAFLWARVRRDVTAFLRTVWLSGALFGASPQESFYVKCDAETNPRELRDLGQMICEIGMAPVKSAEFVIFRFTQWAGPDAE